ncbi:MAG: phytanoyl-CoA dioxygenase family protein [Ilumatobacteraceae bacterium]
MSLATGLPALPADLDHARATSTSSASPASSTLTGAELAALNTRLAEQAAAEREAGLAFVDGGGANQRVWNLPSKGAEFVDLLRKPLVRQLARHILQGDYCPSSHTANIAGPGGAPMVLHSNQGYTPQEIDLPLTMNVMWMLVDFTDDNGATRLVPGSHRVRAEPPRDEAVETVAGVGPAGTALVFDGRVWHGTGANTSVDQYRAGVLGR